MCFPLSLFFLAMPFKARLSDSVPPDVNTISPAFAPSRAATFSLASSRASFASRPKLCRLEALPNLSEKYGSMACRTWGYTGVVAEWSI